MPISVFLLALLAPTAEPHITVTGHAWAPFISPMGEPFRARTATDDTLADWFIKADRNHDGVITAAEMVADAEQFFATLDTNHDGQIDPDELANYEWEIAPDIQVSSKTKRAPGEAATSPVQSDDEDWNDHKRQRERAAEDEASLGIGGALQGAARYGLLDIPEPVAAADADFNREISLEEFRQAAIERFQLLDTAHQGRLSLAQLEALRPVLPATGHYKKQKSKIDPRIGNPLPSGP